jgi:proton-dependent oligopeptide transporter, POT family
MLQSKQYRVDLLILLELHGIPNDVLGNIDAITIIVFIPILNTCLYPVLRQSGIPFRPMARITVGFIIAGLAMLYAAGVQHLIYISVIWKHITPIISNLLTSTSQPPCYDSPLKCAASIDGSIPNKVHVLIQIPAYLLIGFSEIFASVSTAFLCCNTVPINTKFLRLQASNMPIRKHLRAWNPS